MDQADRFWLGSYPDGVPATIDEAAIGGLDRLLADSFRRHASRTAFACMGAVLSYRDLDRMSDAVAAWLQSRGLVPGDRVAVMMPNLLQYPVVLAAILRGGFVLVNVNPLYTPRELEHQLADSGAKAIFVLENFAATVAAVQAHAPTPVACVCSVGDLLGWPRGPIVNFVVRHVHKAVPRFALAGSSTFRAVLAEGGRTPAAPCAIAPTAVACLQYTGGTTGVAKGATLLHRNLYANILQLQAWQAPAMASMPAGEQFTCVAALPLYHVFALTVCALLSMASGGKCVLIPNPRDIKALVAEVRRHRVHCFPAVSTLYNALAADPQFRRLDFSSLRMCLGGGMAVQRAVAQRWLELTGRPICEGYGLSETSPVATANPIQTEEFSGTIGLPLPSTELAILDESGTHLPPGVAGEIAIRGPQVMSGYWQRPDETAGVMTADGFFRTGDIGIMDERGYTRIVDRKKDMILVSGFKVFPNEVEDVVASHPGVRECAVIGIPDERTGEAVKLFVVRADPKLSEQDLVAYCHDNLTGYKRPRFIEFRGELPKTNVGKILRRALRDEAVQAAA